MYLICVEFYTIPVMISPILHKLTSTDEGSSLVSTTRQTITQPVRVSKMHQEGIEGVILVYNRILGSESIPSARVRLRHLLLATHAPFCNAEMALFVVVQWIIIFPLKG